MAGHTYDRRMYDHCIANNCADSEFPNQKRAADMDGEEHPCVAPLLRKADRPGFNRVAATHESASSGGAWPRPVGLPESLPLSGGGISSPGVGEMVLPFMCLWYSTAGLNLCDGPCSLGLGVDLVARSMSKIIAMNKIGRSIFLIGRAGLCRLDT